MGLLTWFRLAKVAFFLVIYVDDSRFTLSLDYDEQRETPKKRAVAELTAFYFFI